MSKAEKIVEILESQVGNVSDFIVTENRAIFEITEIDEEQSYIIKEQISNGQCELVANEKLEVVYDEDKTFKVTNANGFKFIPIDGKEGLMAALETGKERLREENKSRCDCVMFDEKNFCFLEFKFNVKIPEIGKPKKRAIKNNFQKAVNQIKSTIDKFDDLLDKNYQGLKLEAYVVTPKRYPKSSAYTRSIDKKFVEEYKVLLFDVNEKICQ